MYDQLTKDYGIDKVTRLRYAHELFSNISEGYSEAKLKKSSFKKATEGIAKIDDQLDKVVPFISNANAKKTIFGIAEMYNHFEDELIKCKEIIDCFGSNLDGPRNLYLIMLAEIFVIDGKVNWEVIRNILMEQKKICPLVSESFSTLFNTDEIESIKGQKDMLRQARLRAINSDWYKKLRASQK